MSKSSGRQVVLVVGYGTLLHTASAEATMRGGAGREREYVPIVVPGFQRLFNVRPDHYEPSDVIGSPAAEAAAMNVRPAPDHWFNGVAFEASLEELQKLDQREYCYERIHAPIERFGDRRALGEAMIYSCPDDWRFADPNPAELLPLWRDIEWARQGAYALGGAFGRDYDATTFLADGRTLMTEFYADHLPDPRAK